jgi:hypothetical protein
MPKRIQLTESIATLGEADLAVSTSGKIKVSLITAGIGSSGYYSPQVLEAAGKAKVFPAGMHMYLNHVGEAESYDRRNVGRDVRDLAAVLTSDATWSGTGLVAEAQMFGPYAAVLAEMKDAIGVSICATAQVDAGEFDGKTMPIISELIEGLSADFVTHPGRGGSFEVMESRLPSVVTERAVAHGVAEATANDTREAISAALRNEYGDDETWPWLRDFDGTTCWFEISTSDSENTYAQTYELADDGTASLTGTRTEVRARTEYVPVIPAGQTTATQESLEDHMAPKIEVDEAEHRQLTADAGRVRTLEAERDAALTERDTAVTDADTLREAANAQARVRVIREAADAAGVTLDQWQIAGMSADAPVGQDRRVDEAALRTRADEAIAKLAEAGGVGRITGFGHNTTNEGDVVAEAEKAAAGAFGRQIKEA